MTDIHYHVFAADTAELEEKREISGLAAPYGETVIREGRKVRFEKGMFGDVSETHLYFNHEEGLPIGKVFHIEDTDEGLKIKARISRTAKGDEVYTLLRDGVLQKFSVGFIGREQRQEDDTTVWTKVDLHEVSVVPRPAFKSAAIAEVHSADSTNEKENLSNIMDSNENEVAELKEAFSDLERKVALFGTSTPEVKSSFATGGAALKALATGSDEAKQEFAYTGATTTDADVSRPGWINRGLVIIDKGRPVLNAFNREPLPADGLSIEYPFVSATTGDVAVQAAEGDDLAYLEVGIDTASAPVKTYGGYSEISRQAIERSDVSYLDGVLRYQAASYAKVTNAAVRTALTGATGIQTGTAITVDSSTVWIDFVVDGVGLINDNGLGAVADFVLVPLSVFKRIAHLVDDNARVQFDVNGDGSNTIGNANLTGLRGTLAGMPLVVDPGLTGSNVYMVSSQAITSWESPGAPFRLQDENILNLTKQFSLYGYMAVGVTNAKGIVKVNATLA